MKTQGIYTIRHVASGRVYVGSAVDVAMRWHIHRHHLQHGTHHSRPLQDAWAKDGAPAFTFSIVEVVPDARHLLIREQWWIDELNAIYTLAGFNCCQVAGSPLGTKASPEARAKMRAAKLGKPAPWNSRKHTPEQNEAHRLAMTGRKRGPHPPETIARMRAVKLGNTHGKGNRGNIRPPVTAETRAKLSAAVQHRLAIARGQPDRSPVEAPAA